MALIEKLKAIGDAIRGKTGGTEPLTLDEMAETITALEGEEAKTYILVDDDGNEIPAVLVDEEVTLTATPNDIRIGTTAVTGDGVVEGTKEIPSYHTYEGRRVVTNGSKFTVTHKDYDYTKFQAIICGYNTNLDDSVAAIKVVISDNVYEVDSTISLSEVVKDSENSRIDLGIVNDSGAICILRYFMYKEIY